MKSFFYFTLICRNLSENGQRANGKHQSKTLPLFPVNIVFYVGTKFSKVLDWMKFESWDLDTGK